MSNLHDTDYARRCRDIMDLYKNLSNLGVHASFDLPRVVVIGSQSSGKSSLVEAVTGIRVPRDSGACTRCPMECTLSSNAKSWSCIIKIRREYYDNGMRLPSPSTDQFGEPLERKEEVELWIRRAQAAVLSPGHRPFSHFYDMSEEDLKAFLDRDLKFSKNVIHIMIKDPDATDLSFVDLPGLITNAREDHLIDTVKCMVEEYIKGPNTLIVIAMPMTDDYQNMQAVRLANAADVDPDGNRTIGVLTKPDLINSGATGMLSNWAAVLKGNKYQTRHGYYCVRLLEEAERTLGLSNFDAQQREADFFDRTPPWSELEDRARFGVPNFVRFVSTLLMKRIDDSIPELRTAVRNDLSRCKDESARLPPVYTEDPGTEIVLRISNFCKALRDVVFGQENESFVRDNRIHYSIFKNAILQTAPDFRPFEGPGLSNPHQVPSGESRQPKGLEYVRQKVLECHAWELPAHAPYKFKATRNLIREFVSLWVGPAHQCFDEVLATQTRYLWKLIEEHFDSFPLLMGYVSELIFSERDRCRDGAKAMLGRILRMEYNPLFTQNFDELSAQQLHWYEVYIEGMNSNTDAGTPGPNPSLAGGVPWSKEDEVRIMANVQAYFQVTYQRIIDNVPLIIELEVNENFSESIQKFLLGTMMKDVQTARVVPGDLLREDTNIATRREYLEDKISRLQSILANLERFSRNDSGPA